jgi:hypothetical protein
MPTPRPEALPRLLLGARLRPEDAAAGAADRVFSAAD